MSAADCLVVLGEEPEGPGPVSRTLHEAIDALDGVAAVRGADDAAARLDTEAGQPAVSLAVIGPAVDRPLSVGRQLRRMASSLGLAFVVGDDEVQAMEIRLGLVPELQGAAVVAVGGSASELAVALRSVRSSLARRREVRGALDAMNRQLLRRSDEPAQDRQSVSQSYLATLVRHVPEAILSVDAEGCLVAANDAAVEAFGLQARTVEGTALADVVGADDGSEVLDVARAALDGRTVTGREVRVSRVEGPSLLLSVTAAPVHDHRGRAIGAVLLLRDITEERRTQQRLQELQRAESLATLAGGVAHDFNNLLVSVKSWSQLAAEDLDDREFVSQALDRIGAAADRAASLARAMLVYSGRGTYERGPVDVNEVVRGVTDLLHGSISRKIEVDLRLGDDLPTVVGDVTQLRQVMTNLVTNAAEAIGDDEGSIVVTTSVTGHVEGPAAGSIVPAPRYVVVEVADTGPGMDEATRRRVFEPFFSTKFEGRGLGLASSHGIVRAHGGSLTVASLPGEGARFRMVVPVDIETGS